MPLRAAVILFYVAVVYGQSCTEMEHCNVCSNPGPTCVECPSATVMSGDRTRCLSCPVNCDECETDTSEAVLCSRCTTGYYLNAGLCTYCGSGCEACHVQAEDGLVVCDHCAEGFVMDVSLTSQACIACTSRCKQCSLDEGGIGTTCLDCYNYVGQGARGYFLRFSDKLCVTCPSSCEGCYDNGLGDGICTSCYDTHVISVDEEEPINSGKACYRCPTECSACSGVEFNTGVATCTACTADMGNYLSGGECISCSSQCATCDENGDCVDCENYYRLDGTGCIECPPFCQSCADDTGSGEETCVTCDVTYGVKAASSVTCDSCGLYQCDICSRLASGLFVCSSCKEGYGFNNNRECTACSIGCSHCSWSGDHMKCTACQDGYTNDVHPSPSTANNPATCTACGANCLSCTHDGSGTVQCLECVDGYFVDASSGTEVCEPLTSTCVIGDGATGGCQACVEGFTLQGDTCVSCTAPACADCPVSLDVCDGCQLAHVMVDTGTDDIADSCETCGITRCEECISVDVTAGGTKRCSRCQLGYVHYAPTAPADKHIYGSLCKRCPSNCDSCEVNYEEGDKTECLFNGCAVWDGKKAFAHNDAGGCVECPESCTSCFYDLTLLQTICESNQCDGNLITDDTTGLCVACPDHCDSCYHDTTLAAVLCEEGSCDQGYGRMEDGQCAICPANCDGCSLDQTSQLLVCDSCYGGYGINDDVCGKCPPNCIECREKQGAMECLACKDGYAFDGDNICRKCPVNCLSCSVWGSTNITCEVCATGFALSDDKFTCVACVLATFEHCVECSGSGGMNGTSGCDACRTGYTLIDDDPYMGCISTSSLSCEGGLMQDPGYECSDCQEGYTLSEDKKCGIVCYSCGDVSAYVNQTTMCKIQLPGANLTEGDATLTTCTGGACYAAYSKGNVMAGCVPPTFHDGVCGDAYQDGEMCVDTPSATICERCCVSDYCNSFVALMDGLPGTGDHTLPNVTVISILFIILSSYFL